MSGSEGLPPVIREAADRATEKASFPYQQMVHLQEYLRRGYTYDVKAAPGHSYGHLRFFLGDTKRGTAEQFASAFAVMARSLGFPARVVVGFGVSDSKAGQPADVSTSDALAWPEVQFDGLGWVPFYPTPQQSTEQAATKVQRSVGQSEARAEIDDKIARARPGGAPTTKPKAFQPPPEPGRTSPWPIVAIIVGLLVFAFLAYALTIVLVRRGVTARRRTGGDARARVVGAWQQSLEHLKLAGVEDAPNRTPAELVGRAVDTIGAAAEQPMTRLADVARGALFAPEAPDLQAADAGWTEADRIGRLAREHVGRAATRLGAARRRGWGPCGDICGQVGGDQQRLSRKCLRRVVSKTFLMLSG
jgi:hypothetical protein